MNAPPLQRTAVVDRYFLEHRAKLLDLAAYLDRVERAASAPGAAADGRHEALRSALAILSDGRPERARRILELLSDPSADPISASPGKGALGAYVPAS